MTVAIRKVSIPRENRLVSQGQTVNIIAAIADVEQVSVLIDPVYVPLISLFDPSDVQLVSDAVMTKLSIGIYSYNYQATNLSNIGIYTANITALHVNSLQQNESARVEKVSVFKVIKTTTFTSFNYFAVKDQVGAVWYWYVAGDNTLTSSATIPSLLGKQAVVVDLGVVPSWLQMNNPSGSLRYIYPLTTGEVTVTATQPAVGSGNVGSPTVKGISGSSFVLALNVSDEVILNTV